MNLTPSEGAKYAASLAEAVGQSAENQAMLSFRSMESTLALAEKIADTLAVKSRLLRLKEAADKGHDGAQATYGLALEFQNFGVKRDVRESVRYYKMSSDQGSLKGMYFYADMLEEGKGVEKDTAEALRLYRLAANAGHTQSIGYLGVLYIHGEIVPQDIAKGVSMINRQIQMGDETGY